MFVRAANPIWYMVDHFGLPLNDEYFAFFLTNTLPYIPQAVAQDPNGITDWDFPLRFQPSGTLPDNLYFDPSLVYRIEIRHGNSQTDPLIWEINNFVPGEGNINSRNDFVEAENALTNPQFAQISFANNATNPYTISAAGTYDIAPGWQLVLTGTGTTTLQQLALPGSNNDPGNPPFALEIDNNGWASAKLIQTFQDNGAIFANGAIATTLMVRAFTSTLSLSVNYVPNGTSNPTPLISGATFPTSVFTVLKGFSNVQASQNANTGDSAIVQYVITLPATGKMDITNIQLIGQSTNVASTFTLANVPDFQQETIERQVDHEFHVYADNLITKPKKNLLVGWNFSQNPYQFVDPASSIKAAVCSYIADQTILYQRNAAGSSVSTGKAADFQRYGMHVIAADASNQIALIQYIDPASVLPYWGYTLSVLARLALFSAHNTSVRFKMRLIWRTTLPSTIGAAEPIASWSSGGDPVFSAGWTALIPQNDPAYLLQNFNSIGPTEYPPYSFDKFLLPSNSSTTMTLGVVIYTIDDMNPAAVADSIVFDKIGLTHNDFAVETDPETFDESLRRCQFYYEKSYSLANQPGAMLNNAALLVEQLATFTAGVSNNLNAYGRAFRIQFKQTKRTDTPTILLWSPTAGSSGNVDMHLWNNAGDVAGSPATVAATNWNSFATANADGISYVPANVTALIGPVTGANLIPEAFLSLHYTVDARLGV